MWLFLTVIAILVIYYYRNLIKKYAQNIKVNGVEIDLQNYRNRYPTYCKNIDKYINLFNEQSKYSREEGSSGKEI